jgi:FMN phosphatase YigB (HAD superfamily)
MKLFKTVSLLYIIITASALALCATEQESVIYLPENTEFAWDAHHVLLKPNITEMATIFVQKLGLRSISILTSLSWEYTKYLATGTQGKTLKLALDIYALLYTIGSKTQNYKAVVDEYDPTLWSIAEKMATSWQPTPGMPELIKELNSLGYTQRIATNMGPRDFELLLAKHPEFLGTLQGGLTVDVHEKSKPNIEYFQRYQQQYNSAKNKKVIFVDDNKHHVSAAQKACMVGFVFTNTQQLREELKDIIPGLQ